MNELINFIPGTKAQCLELLQKLPQNTESALLMDKYNNNVTLNAEEIDTLRQLIANQIGVTLEKEAPEAEKAEENPVEKQQPAQKSGKKTSKK